MAGGQLFQSSHKLKRTPLEVEMQVLNNTLETRKEFQQEGISGLK